MIKNIITLVIAALLIGSILYAIGNRPESDPCTPERIAEYTNIMISHQECESESMPRCITEPSDVRDFHDAQTNFRYCVAEISGEAQRQREESETE